MQHIVGPTHTRLSFGIHKEPFINQGYFALPTSRASTGWHHDDERVLPPLFWIHSPQKIPSSARPPRTENPQIFHAATIGFRPYVTQQTLSCSRSCVCSAQTHYSARTPPVATIGTLQQHVDAYVALHTSPQLRKTCANATSKATTTMLIYLVRSRACAACACSDTSKTLFLLVSLVQSCV